MIFIFFFIYLFSFARPNVYAPNKKEKKKWKFEYFLVCMNQMEFFPSKLKLLHFFDVDVENESPIFYFSHGVLGVCYFIFGIKMFGEYLSYFPFRVFHFLLHSLHARRSSNSI